MTRDAKASQPTPSEAVSPTVAAVALPKLRLQLVQRRHARWHGDPIAVVANEGPEAPLLELDRVALRRGLRPGLRQGVARSLVPELRTAIVPPAELEALESELVRGLQTFTPRVEPVPDDAGGAFFVDPRGLERLFGGLDVWASSVHRYLAARRLRASLVCGHHPWLSLAIARVGHGARVIDDPARERREADALSLRALGFSEKLCDPLALLGVETLGGFLALPHGELQTRFGREAAALHRRYGEQGQLPLQPVSIALPRRVQLELDDATIELEPLLFAAKTALDRLLAELSTRGERPLALLVELHLESHAPPGPFGTPTRTLTDDERTLVERLEPAEPTADPKVWLELLRLRLGAIELPAAALELALEAETTHARGHQLQTLSERPKRDVMAAARALARVRATFGDGSVTKATLHDAHLPEARFRWEPLRVLPVLAPRSIDGSSREGSCRSHESASYEGRAFGDERAMAEGKPAISCVGAHGLRAPDMPLLSTISTHEVASPEASPASNDLRSASSLAQTEAVAMPLFAPSDPSEISEGGARFGSSPSRCGAPSPEPMSPGEGAKEVPSSYGDWLEPEAFSHARALSTTPHGIRLQRRLLARPRPLGLDREGRPQPRGERALRFFGPHRTSGGWWGRADERAVERDYYYVETERGALYWVFFDHARRAWFLQGYVD